MVSIGIHPILILNYTFFGGDFSILQIAFTVIFFPPPNFRGISSQKVLTHLVAEPWQRRMSQSQGVEKNSVGRAVHLKAFAPHLLQSKNP